MGATGKTIFYDDVSVKEVQMGNHGTTTFYGDELVTNGTMEADANWGNSSNSPDSQGRSSEQAHSGTYSWKWVDASSSYTGGIKNTTAFTTVTGRKYRLNYWIYNATVNSHNLTIVEGDGTGAISGYSSQWMTGQTVSQWNEITVDYIESSGGSSGYFEVQNPSASGTFYLDDVSIKEVGVAGGWTTAEAEPLIPQTALMGMSKSMVFDAIDDKVVLDDAISDLATQQGTINIWCVPTSDTGTEANIFTYNSSSARTDLLFRYGWEDDRLQIGIAQAGAQKWYAHAPTNSASSHLGSLNMITLTHNGTEPKLYANGAELSLTFPTSTDKTFWLGDMSGVNRCALGLWQYTSDQNGFIGLINEVSIWDDDLTLAEIQELFNDGVALDARTHSLSPSTGTDYLIGYWRNEGLGEWEDLSQNTNDGTPAGSPETILLPEGTTAGKDILGFPLTHTNNGWLNLSGAEYVDVGMNFDGMTDFTLEAWARINVYAANNRIIGCETSGEEQHLRLGGSANVFEAKFDIGGSTETIAGTTTIDDGEWHYVTVVYDGTNLKIYTDADDVQSTAASGTVEINGKNLFIGARNDNGTANSFLKGQVDEVRIYDKALTSSQITKNWKHGKSKHS
jgi:hypothetical protein